MEKNISDQPSVSDQSEAAFSESLFSKDTACEEFMICSGLENLFGTSSSEAGLI